MLQALRAGGAGPSAAVGRSSPPCNRGTPTYQAPYHITRNGGRQPRDIAVRGPANLRPHCRRPPQRLQLGAKKSAVHAGESSNATTPVTGLVEALAAAHQQLQDEGVDWGRQLGIALLASFTFGTAFQVTHNNGYLPKYDALPFQVGPFLESGTVPLLLAPIWLLYAYLQPLVDKYFGDDDAVARAVERAKDPSFHAAVWAAMAATFILSDILYLNNVPHWQISLILAACCLLNWQKFDGTKGGAILGALLLSGAPLAETFIVNVLQLWHYDRPDFFGVPHWAGWCYASYAWGVGNFGRYLVHTQKGEHE